MRLIGDGEKGEGVMEVGGGGRGRLYIYRYTVTTRMTPALRWAAMSHFNVSFIVRDKVTSQCPRTTTFKEKGEPKQIRTQVLLLTSLTPYRLAKSTHPPPTLPFSFSFFLFLFLFFLFFFFIFWGFISFSPSASL